MEAEEHEKEMDGHLDGCCCGALHGRVLRRGEEKETVSAVADGVLTVGIVNGGDIFASKEGDTYSGIEPMLVNALGDALDVTVEYVEVSGTQELLQLLDAGTVDAAVGRIAENDAYSQRYLSTRNYGKKGLYLVTRRNDYTDTLVGFSQMNVGITQAVPSNLRVEIPGLEDVNVSEYPDTTGIPAGLAEEVIAAAVCTERRPWDSSQRMYRFRSFWADPGRPMWSSSLWGRRSWLDI